MKTEEYRKIMLQQCETSMIADCEDEEFDSLVKLNENISLYEIFHPLSFHYSEMIDLSRLYFILKNYGNKLVLVHTNNSKELLVINYRIEKLEAWDKSTSILDAEEVQSYMLPYSTVIEFHAVEFDHKWLKTFADYIPRFHEADNIQSDAFQYDIVAEIPDVKQKLWDELSKGADVYHWVKVT